MRLRVKPQKNTVIMALFLWVSIPIAQSPIPKILPKMIERMEKHHFPLIYLWDDTQETAKDYGALRTPHFSFSTVIIDSFIREEGLTLQRMPQK